MSRDSGLGPVLGTLYTGITRSVSPLPDRSGWGGRHFARVVSGRVLQTNRENRRRIPEGIRTFAAGLSGFRNTTLYYFDRYENRRKDFCGSELPVESRRRSRRNGYGREPAEVRIRHRLPAAGF